MSVKEQTLKGHPDSVFTDKSAPRLMDEIDALAESLNVPITVVPGAPKIDAITQALLTAHGKLSAMRTELGKIAHEQREEALRLARLKAALDEREARINAFDVLSGQLIAFEPKQEKRASWWRR
jgi:replicative DNA helicase